MNKKNRKVTTYFILFSLLVIGVVYAILQANLQINGIAKIKSNTWNIYFDNIVINENSVSIGENDSPATIDPENNCKVDFEVTLSLPGDFYEFTVDVVNAGTIDGMIGTLTKTLKVNNEAVSEVPDYLNYSVTYSDGLEILEKHALRAGVTETYLIRLEFRSDIEELPDAVTISTSLEPEYIQADSGAIKVPHPQTLLDTIAENAVIDNIASTYVTNANGIQFNDISSDTNGKGIYLRAGTENDTYPIYYYRGDIDNNHVKFANFCWRIVRTTDTGGVKLIYDGVPKNIYDQVPLSQNQYTISTNDANFTWNATDKTWDATITDGQNHEISFTVPAGEGYNFIMSGTTGSTSGGSYYLYKDGTQVYGNGGGGGQALSYTHDFGTLTASNIIKFVYQGSSTTEAPITFKIKMTQKGELLGVGCNNTGTDTHISTTNTIFNTNYNSPAYVGYMYGDVYTYSSATGTNWYYAPDVTYENGTYTLTSKGSYNVEKKSTISGTNLNYHHYTCGSTTATTCTSVRYVYYVSNSLTYYITLSNGKKVEDALSEMFSNTTNSPIKTAIDTWYQSNMTSYTNKLEDTVYCNDRSIGTLNGWNPDGGNVTGSKETDYSLLFSGYNRAYTTYVPTLECINKNDAFTVRESGTGNGKLTYPVGLLTSDEAMLAGMKGGTGGANYLNNSTYYWLGSPGNFVYNYSAYEFYVYSGNLNNGNVYLTNGVRCAVSLKPGMKISGGSGTSSDPYIVE